MAEDNNGDPNGDTGNEDKGGGNEPDDLETWKSDARKWERRAKENADAAKRATEAEARLAEIENSSKSDHEKEIDKVRTEAAEEARKEATAAANRRIVTAEVKAIAAGKLADPTDAVRLLDLEEFVLNDDGEVDTKAVNDAVTRLLKEKPYLAADTKRKHGDGDQGARGRSGSNSGSMNDLIRQKAGRA